MCYLKKKKRTSAPLIMNATWLGHETNDRVRCMMLGDRHHSFIQKKFKCVTRKPDY